MFVVSSAITHPLLKSVGVHHWLCDNPKRVQNELVLGKGRL